MEHARLTIASVENDELRDVFARFDMNNKYTNVAYHNDDDDVVEWITFDDNTANSPHRKFRKLIRTTRDHALSRIANISTILLFTMTSVEVFALGCFIVGGMMKIKHNQLVLPHSKRTILLMGGSHNINRGLADM